MTKFLFFTLCFLLTVSTCFSQEIIPLWPEGIPNDQETNETETRENGDIVWIEKVQKPTLEIYLPTKKNATGRAVVICPGGGYRGLAYDWEGTDIAKYLNSKGIAAFVLKYRLPKSKDVISGYNAPLHDAQRAIRLVRQNAEKWNVSKDQIGVMGFSAGGHLASTLGTHYDQGEKSNTVDSLSARPDFMVLIYPVITMKAPTTHGGSRNNLIGEKPKQEFIDLYSNELYVNKNTPPTFILHSSDDKSVPVENSILFYQALQREGVYSEIHIYPTGGHGFSLAIGQGHLQSWVERLWDWMDSLE
ncbi:alpha/beta hydrolase [Reichenbachiella ulvae]|uniref:Alpha/beta hydrolase n=1 Tax=Reichenbachiella ulvae TaxID=2980104 RepID=A0ABT3CQ67_9BACT|nr:alpha/beta hydrolase [Reichenbachiella ulvae]MCV9385614.1 alpha/beta hydrolase [Reichenbachiella ulvae]